MYTNRNDSKKALDLANRLLESIDVCPEIETHVEPSVESGAAIYFLRGKDEGWSRLVGIFIDADGDATLYLRAREQLRTRVVGIELNETNMKTHIEMIKNFFDAKE